jgi:hypothetical protein
LVAVEEFMMMEEDVVMSRMSSGGGEKEGVCRAEDMVGGYSERAGEVGSEEMQVSARMNMGGGGEGEVGIDVEPLLRASQSVRIQAAEYLHGQVAEDRQVGRVLGSTPVLGGKEELEVEGTEEETNGA